MSYFNIVAATNESAVMTEYSSAEIRSDAYQSEATLEKEFIELLKGQSYDICRSIRKKSSGRSVPPWDLCGRIDSYFRTT